MLDNTKRFGKITSSKAYLLDSLNAKKNDFGAGAITYLNEKATERRIGRSVNLNKGNNTTIWGHVAEYYCERFHFDFDYKVCSRITLEHHVYEFWGGTPDFIKNDYVGDIKCFEPLHFGKLSYLIAKIKDGKKSLDDFKSEEKEIYWQIVSNACITGLDKGMVSLYIPTLEQLEIIREEIYNGDISNILNIDPYKLRFIYESPIDNLPWIDTEKHENYIEFEFDIPKEDKEYLTELVIKANNKINEINGI